MPKSRTDRVFEQYYEQYIEYIKGYCYYKLNDYPDYAEDCVQDTFRVLFEKLSEDIEFEYIKAFLIKTASNFVKLKFREIDKSKNKTISIEAKELDITYEQSFFDDVNEDTILNLKDEIISSLSFEEQRLLIQTCKQNKDSYLTTKQLAIEYNCSETNIRQRIFVLRTKIKRLVKEKTKNL
ncbi:MAG: sigma-70 family RNA polymerase sigma factor [Eubacterium sp.]|nr:sigma-70 family RNA polymerase sigma factor [Eubacterium sp.]